MTSVELDQVSGAVASRVNPHVVWVHNDVGDGPRIFAITDTGRLLGIYAVPGAAALDFEDIAVGPGPETNVMYLYIGDIGDNNATRTNVTILRAPEPPVYLAYTNAPVARSLTNVAALRCVYPSGPRNAESLMVDPLTTNLYIASKTAPSTTVYCVSADAFAHGVCTLALVRVVTSVTTATAGDISARGDLIFLRSQTAARLWLRNAGERVEDALGRTPLAIPLQSEQQGEAISADALGNDYFTTSEGLHRPLYRYARTNDGGVLAQTLIPPGSSWRWHAADGSTSDAWRLLAYDDSGWAAGSAPCGTNYDLVATTIAAPALYAWTTIWFRTSCAPPQPPCTTAWLRVTCADGAVVYLNGSEIARINVPGTAQDALATEYYGVRGCTWRSIVVPPQLLLAPTCMLAAEVHHAAGADGFAACLFDAQLEATSAVPEIGWAALLLAALWCLPRRGAVAKCDAR